MKRNILLGLFLMGLIIVGLGYVKDSSNISANETTTSQSTANVTETTEESSTDKQIPYIPRLTHEPTMQIIGLCLHTHQQHLTGTQIFQMHFGTTFTSLKELHP
ncbi:hypothetical protein GQR36_27390 [Enterococcus termitis]